MFAVTGDGAVDREVRDIASLEDCFFGWKPVDRVDDVDLVFSRTRFADLVLARARDNVERLHRSDWKPESVHVLLNVDLASRNYVESGLVFFTFRLLRNIIKPTNLVVLWSWNFVLLCLRNCVGIV